MPTFAQLAPEYKRLLDTVNVTREAAATAASDKVFRNGNRYIRAATATGVPWPLIGTLDLRESDCDPGAALGQGDPWNRVSTHVPRGKGPFRSWEDAAKFYIGYDDLNDPPGPWDMVMACFMGEKWNGWGYRNKGIFTPYLWAGTNHYQCGKYVADGQYSSSAVDQQLGIIAVMYMMVKKDPDTYIGSPMGPPIIGSPPTVPEVPSPQNESGTFWIQKSLNTLMAPDLDQLVVDGNFGRRTTRAVKNFQYTHDLKVDGKPGDVTTAAMDAGLKRVAERVTP